VHECKPLEGGCLRSRGEGRVREARGRAAQVDPIKPELKALGANILTLKYDEVLSKFAFNFILRRYSKVTKREAQDKSAAETTASELLKSKVGRCRLTL